MAVVSSNSSGYVIDTDKSAQSFMWAIPAGPVTPQTITPAEEQQGFTVVNGSPDIVRIRINFVPGVTSAVPPAQRVHVVPPGGSHQVDFGAKHAGDSMVTHVIASILVDVVDAPVTITPEDSGLLATGTAIGGLVTFNFASA